MDLNKQQFFLFLENLEQQIEKQDRLRELGIDDLEFNTNLWSVFDYLSDCLFGEKGCELLNWWIYEAEFGKCERVVDKSDIKTKEDLFESLTAKKD